MSDQDYFSSDEIEEKKKAIFDAMGKRGQKQIMKTGYEEWNPFAEPKDPIDLREDKTKRTTQMLIREFLQSRSHEEYSTDYAAAAFELALGIINDKDRSKGMFDFACWYGELLKKEGHDGA